MNCHSCTLNAGQDNLCTTSMSDHLSKAFTNMIQPNLNTVQSTTDNPSQFSIKAAGFYVPPGKLAFFPPCLEFQRAKKVGIAMRAAAEMIWR